MIYQKLQLDEERALYAVKGAIVDSCTFAGPADGESALKECRDIEVKNCHFELRYPFWHVIGAKILDSVMTEGCRAALWYDEDILLKNCQMNGIKALRECDRITLQDCRIHSPEFAWKCRDLKISHCELESEYPFFECSNMNIDHLVMKGKYSFQYMENVEIKDSELRTKDAFWHSKNVTVTDTVLEGEYLGWYSENLTLIRCKIIGTQPLCYAKNLVLEDCTMEKTDLSFERSEVTATIRGGIDSVKNPISGSITADSIGEIILDDTLPQPSVCEIQVRK